MTARQYRVSFLEGQVAKVTEKGQDRYHVTVEVPEERRAYGLTVSSSIRPLEGSWVRFRGIGSLVTVAGGRLKVSLYLHDPIDGSPKEMWSYEELYTDMELFRIAEPKVMRSIRKAAETLLDLDMFFYENWSDPSFFRSLESILESALNTARARRQVLAQAQAQDPGLWSEL